MMGSGKMSPRDQLREAGVLLFTTVLFVFANFLLEYK